MSIKERIDEVQHQLPDEVRLVVVSKFHSVDEIMEAYHAGIRDFGENHVQELLSKVALLPNDIRWHFIGNLQRNKVKQLLPVAHMIQGVSSERLYREIVTRASMLSLCPDILIEVHIGQEETKDGFAAGELMDYLRHFVSQRDDHPHRRIRGLMGMASFTDDKEQVRREFKELKALFEIAKKELFADDPYFDTLSMGMSSDWKIAVEEGSTLVRIGSYIMGERDYNK